MDKIPKVLFLSKGNASRAQIAEGFLRNLAAERFNPVSAGTDSNSVHPLAAEVMSEIGVDISTQQPREIASLFRDTFRYAVVVSDEPHEKHPVFPFTTKMLRWSIPDPELATGEVGEQKQAFRDVRDLIRDRVDELIEATPPAPVFTEAHAAAA